MPQQSRRHFRRETPLLLFHRLELRVDVRENFRDVGEAFTARGGDVGVAPADGASGVEPVHRLGQRAFALEVRDEDVARPRALRLRDAQVVGGAAAVVEQVGLERAGGGARGRSVAQVERRRELLDQVGHADFQRAAGGFADLERRGVAGVLCEREDVTQQLQGVGVVTFGVANERNGAGELGEVALLA